MACLQVVSRFAASPGFDLELGTVLIVFVFCIIFLVHTILIESKIQCVIVLQLKIVFVTTWCCR